MTPQTPQARMTYVFGHRNPDTDAIVSSIAYAALKRQQGLQNCIPARAGKLTPQTEYILQRFNVHPPKFIPDMLPKVEYFLQSDPQTIQEGAPLWDALELMDRSHLAALPVVDAEGKYKALLTYNTFAKNMVHKTDPHRKVILPTSIDLIINTIKAQPVVIFNQEKVIKSRIIVSDTHSSTFETNLSNEIVQNAIVLVSDRQSIIEKCIQHKIRAVILTGGTPLSKSLRAQAEAAKVSILISPYNTASTIYLLLYSIPVSTMADASIMPVLSSDVVRDIQKQIQLSPSRSLAVVNEADVVIGTLNERDLFKLPNVDIIMVDHNELSQAVEGLKQFRIIEIIDHHRLGNFPTHMPITFINRVVGATSTVVAGLYQEQKVRMTQPIAGLLLAGIITDTLGLRSTTTTDVDRDMAEYLAGILDLDIDALTQDIFTHASKLTDLTMQEIFSTDTKAYVENEYTFAISQVESGSTDDLETLLPDLIKTLQERCAIKKHFFEALMITDITALNSILIVAGDARFCAKIPFPAYSGNKNAFFCKGILSRKKQLLPLLIEQLEMI